MTFDIGKILQSKREFRRRMAALPIEEKLAMLDALRERALLIRPGGEKGALKQRQAVQEKRAH